MAKVSPASPVGVTPRIAIVDGIPSGPGLPLESSSNTWPRRFMLSRPIRVPSAVTQVQESPCVPPVDWMTKCLALAGGFASSDAGTCANTTDDATAVMVARKNVRSIPIRSHYLSHGLCDEIRTIDVNREGRRLLDESNPGAVGKR